MPAVGAAGSSSSSNSSECEKRTCTVSVRRNRSMCINATMPAWARVRHWSAPERVPEKAPVAPPTTPTAVEQDTRVIPWELPMSLEEQFEAAARLQFDEHWGGGFGAKEDSVEVESRSLSAMAFELRQRLSGRMTPATSSVSGVSWAVRATQRRRQSRDEPEVEEEESERTSGGGERWESTTVPEEHRRTDPSPLKEEENEAVTAQSISTDRSTAAANRPPLLSAVAESSDRPPPPTEDPPPPMLSQQSSRQWKKRRRRKVDANAVIQPHVPNPWRRRPASLSRRRCRVPEKSELEEEEETRRRENLLPTPPHQSSYPAYCSSSASPESKGRGRKATGENLLSLLNIRSVSLLTFALVCLIAPASAEVCNTVYLDNLSDLNRLENCTTIEGSLVIKLGLINADPDLNETYSYPKLREITDFLMVYKANKLRTLNHLFPNLAVIRGNKLVSEFALVMYRNEKMEDIGLTGLTTILRGGVRISMNPLLCYVDTVDWRRIVANDEARKKHIVIEYNEQSNVCPDVCPGHCETLSTNSNRKSCWNGNSCQRVEVDPSRCRFATADMKCFSVDGQRSEPKACHKECVGGCTGHQPTDCFACKNVFYERGTGGDDGGRRRKGTCVDPCPAPFLKFKDWRCITKTECKNKTIEVSGENYIQKKYYRAYLGQCLRECPKDTKDAVDDADGTPTCAACKDCPKKCPGRQISSMDDLKELDGCTHITGDLRILLSSRQNVVEKLEKYLGRVQEIRGFLKITRSQPIVSLDFFRSLRVIWGETADAGKKYYSLQIMENENLAKLFPVRPDGSTVRIYHQGSGAGRAYIRDNGKLCRSEIERMIRESGLVDPPDDNDVSYKSNGYTASCSSNKLNVTYSHMSARIMWLFFDNYQETIVKEHPNVDYREPLLGYHIRYHKIDKATYEARNMTKYDGRDACGGDEWMVEDHIPTEPKISGSTETWPREMLWLKVEPYTYYALYVSTLLMRRYLGEDGIRGAESDMIYFLTHETFPGPPRNIIVEKTNYSSLNITWSPPASPNGIIDHYEVILKMKKTNVERTLDRDYCDEGFRVTDMSAEETKPKEPDRPIKYANDTLATGDVCLCTTCAPMTTDQEPTDIQSQRMSRDAFDNVVINIAFPTKVSVDGKKRRRRAVITDVANEQEIELGEDDLKDANTLRLLKTTTTVAPGSPRELPDDSTRYDVLTEKDWDDFERPKSSVIDLPDGRYYYYTYSAEVGGDRLYAFVTHLRHYGSYTLSVRACHAVKEDGTKLCSRTEDLDVQVLHKAGADDIFGNAIRLVKANDTEVSADVKNGKKGEKESALSAGSAWISWDPPPDPNELIVNYNVKLNQGGSGDKDTVHRSCITARDFRANGRKYKLEFAGSYYVSVQAVSVYGPGNWTKELYVTVNQEKNIPAVVVPILALLVIIIAVSICLWMRRRNKPGWNGDTVTANEFYDRFEYQQDHWEVHRNDVVIGRKLGSGTFGEVFYGDYNDPEKGAVACAIKQVREESDFYRVRMFLGEAEFMKPFCSEHVVRLIGVVSIGMPHLILMELMANGDLRQYLIKLRPTANGDGEPPTINEIKLMALQIADGMAYLSCMRPKAVVHRDLAARNCLVTADKVVKISDFGMARQTYEDDVYRMENRGMMPVRWLPPETLRDGTSTTQSDVWSFGVVLWEMATLGEMPYQGMENNEVLNNVKEGGTLGRPDVAGSSGGLGLGLCDDDLWQLMRECWQYDAAQVDLQTRRPTFVEICQRLRPAADDRFNEKSFFTSAEGQSALGAAEEDRAREREARERAQREREAAQREREQRALEQGRDPAWDETVRLLEQRAPEQGRDPAWDETVRLLEQHNQSQFAVGSGTGSNGNHNGSETGGGRGFLSSDQENGQISSGSGNAVEMRQLGRQISAPPTSHSGGALILAGSGSGGGGTGGGTGGGGTGTGGTNRSSASVLDRLSGGGGSGGTTLVARLMPNGIRRKHKSGSAASTSAA